MSACLQERIHYLRHDVDIAYTYGIEGPEMKKKLLVIGIILGLLCLGGGLFLRFYLDQHLFLSPKSDQDLIEILFETDFPGYREFEVLSSEGEGIRKIPRQVGIAVMIEAYPEPMVCEGEIYYAMGDPMALNVQWHTIECVGQMTLMQLARSTMLSGLDLDNCHAETINNLLAYWIWKGVIQPDEVLSPELREILVDLAEDDLRMENLPALNAGLFDTKDVIIHQVVAAGEMSEPAYVLRCDGRVDLYLVRYWNEVYKATKRNAGDIFLPDTLTRQEVLEIQELEGKATPQKGVEVEVTVIPQESCQGWNCEITGTIYEGSVEAGNQIPKVEISLSQFSYCSPTAGKQITTTDQEGNFSFEVFLHDTDTLTFGIEDDKWESFNSQVMGMDCLYCSCVPLELVIEP